MVKEFVKGSHITFVRNPYYWEKGKPYLNSVRFNFATDSNSRILAVRGGSAQIMDGVPFSQISSLQADKNVRVQSAKVPLFLGLWLNHQAEGLHGPQRAAGDAVRAQPPADEQADLPRAGQDPQQRADGLRLWTPARAPSSRTRTTWRRPRR